ncbi:MAG TPA: hypothetical protein VGW34_03875 [Allosphingosinicella sp.]|nr:hypothetical protein [Allosphingosinicella sp.]
MPRDVAAESRRLEQAGRGIRDQLTRAIGRLINPHHLAARLFYGEDGELKPEAVEWFADLARRNFVDSPTFDIDARVDAKNQGRRELALEIMGSVRLDTAKLARLTRQLREVEHD